MVQSSGKMVFIRFLRYFFKGFLSLRYQITVKGFKDIKSLKGRKPGVLFLPNHPAVIDPVILMTIIAPDFFPKSLIAEDFYLKSFQKFLNFFRVVPIPNVEEKATCWKKKVVDKILDNTRRDLLGGENYLIYPAGKLKHFAMESIGGASFVHRLVQKNPEIPIVLVRTTGLWGSSFSRAQTGRSPNILNTVKLGLSTVFKNGIFFVPKRKVLIEFSYITSPIPCKSRLEFNRFLENWYNQYPYPGEEPLSLPAYSRWDPKKKIPLAAILEKKEEILFISPEIETEVKDYLSKLFSIDNISIDSHLSFDLGLDSLDIAQIYSFLDRKYGVSEIEPGSLVNVKDIIKIASHPNRFSLKKEKKSPTYFPNFQEAKKRKRPKFPDGKVIAEVFLNSCNRMKSQIACADRTTVFSYRSLKRSALIFSLKLKILPGKNIGVLLPSSVAVNLSVLSLFLAKKVPVMLNWTAGRKSLSDALKQGAFEAIITSKKFLDTIPSEDLEEIADLFVFLEDIKNSISIREKLRGIWLSFFSTKQIMNKLTISSNPHQTAVILFTSGTEFLPKAVPLTHYQILMNQKGVMDCIKPLAKDCLYGVLPPFHSFGFSLTGLFPLLLGLKMFYAPDPTDSRQMALDISQAKITMLCCAPSFIRPLIAEATKKQLKTLKILVSGAEKMPQDLLRRIKKKVPHVTVIEGYGITECSPVITAQRRKRAKKGVGEPIPGVLVSIVDPESLLEMPVGEKGEICISGPSVFNGYLGANTDSFFYRDEKKWYRSGDLGHLDKKGTLYITDRTKRMMKIGGEMVSLGGLELEFLNMAQKYQWVSPMHEGPSLAVIEKGQGGQKAEIVLFTTFPADKKVINQQLRNSGFARIVKVSEVIQVKVIPVTSTGKTHHRMLEKWINKEA